MAFPWSTELFGLAAAVEATYGSDESPTFAANAIRLAEAPDGPNEQYLFPNQREDEATGGLGALAPAEPGGRFHEWTYRVVGLGAGAAYAADTLPNVDPMLQTVFSSTVDTTSGSETVTYVPSDNPETGVTLYTEVANKQYITRGAICQGLTVSAEAGEMPMWEFQMIGIADLPTEQALETATYSNVTPPVFENASATIDPGTDGGASYSPVIRSYELDLGLDVAPRGDGNAVNPHLGYRIVRRRPTLSVVMEIDALANVDPHDLRDNATQVALDLTSGTAQFGRFDFDFDDARLNDITRSDDSGLEVWDAEFGLFSNTGAEVTIIFD